MSSSNLDKLITSEGTSVTLPSSVTLSPGQTFVRTFMCEGVERSQNQGDVHIFGLFTDNATGNIEEACADMTVIELIVNPRILYPALFAHRHCFGVCEDFDVYSMPSALRSFSWETSGKVYKTNLQDNCQSFTLLLNSGKSVMTFSYMGVKYDVLVESFEPSDALCREQPICCYGPLSQGQAGGVGMDLRLTLQPDTVSFSRMRIMELACFEGEHSGYFDRELFRPLWSHLRGEGAYRVVTVGCHNDFGDTAKIDAECPELEFGGWESGNITWNIPVVWRPREGYVVSRRGKRFMEKPQVFLIDEFGTCQVKKYGWRVVRTVLGYTNVSLDDGDDE